MTKKSIFNSEDSLSEIERLNRTSKTVNWSPQEGFNFELVIPQTVYPPREDTDMLAKRLISIGPGRGKKILEVGCGSGAISILASYLGWKVSCCDVNPFAVAATIGNLDLNRLEGVVKEGGIGPEKFPFESKYDLIVWNLPYIPLAEVDQLLGPMEEASLLDTDDVGLGNRLLKTVERNQLLSPKGRILTLGRDTNFNFSVFSNRKWDEIRFDDGEKLVITCHWKPFEGQDSIFKERTGSTNDDLMEKTGVGTHFHTSWQDSGRGRRDRTWTSIEGGYAGSWIIREGNDFNPGMLQLSAGLAVLKTVDDKRLKLKWPNDIILEERKLCGILVEGKTSGNMTKVILGIGVNLNCKENQNLEYASLDEIQVFGHEEFDSKLHRNLASLLEQGVNLPPLRHDDIRYEVLEQMKRFGLPEHNNVTYDSFELNDRGQLVLGGKIIDDGEDVFWN